MANRIENHMVAGGAAPPEGEGVYSPREVRCAGCGAIGYRVPGDGWYERTIVSHDDRGDYLEGDGSKYDYAQEGDAGWTCSRKCTSQAIYDRATPEERTALRSFGVALMSIVIASGSFSDDLSRHLRNALEIDRADDLHSFAATAERLLAALAIGEAPWTHKASDESSLRSALLRIEGILRTSTVPEAQEILEVIREGLRPHTIFTTQIGEYYVRHPFTSVNRRFPR